MLLAAMLATVLTAQAQTWPDVTADLPQSTVGRGDAAVLVGISDYFQIADVPGAVDNVTDWRRYLVSQGVPLASIKLLSNGDATRESILREAEWAADRVQPGGKLWFVYVGHGAPAPDGRDGLLVGADAQGAALSLEARSARRSEVLEALAGGEQSETVVVVDACFSGKSSSSDMLAENLMPVIPTALATVRSATVLSAGKSDQFAGPLPGLNRPAFSYLTLGALRGWGDADGDGNVTATEAVEYAGGALSALLTDRRQEPVVSGENVSVVLGSGRDAGPDLLAIADSMLDRGPVIAVVDAGRGTTSVNTASLAERLRQRECQAAADAEAEAQRDATLRREGAALERRLAADWAELKSTAESCADQDDAAFRRECRDAVATFAREAARGATVRMTDGEQEVRTDCGTLRGLAPAASLSVAEDVIEEAEALLAAYTDDFRLGTSATLGGEARSPVLGALKWIPAGTFTMGSPTSETGRDDDETQHRVTLTSGYWMMEREVTQGMWRSVMGRNPSHFSSCGDACPVEMVSWTEAVDFARRLSSREGVTYRLPTEAEWEYAARAGESHAYVGSRSVTAVGWVSENSNSRTHPGCQKTRNGHGLCDMSGNVWEWTGDWYGSYPSGSATDPTGPQSGSYRVARGGSWSDTPRRARVGDRGGRSPGSRYGLLGFRLVRTNP